MRVLVFGAVGAATIFPLIALFTAAAVVLAGQHLA